MKSETPSLMVQQVSQVLQVRQAPDESEHEQLEKKLKELIDSIRETKNAISLADGLKSKSWLSLLGGNLTGKNQKELAQIVEDLAKSLKFTQTALELVMQLQNRKHVVLKDFYAAVITKIENIQNDTTTLDDNQREATIYILSELRDNIADQIRYRELVDEHENKFNQVSDFIEEKNAGDSEHDDIHDVLEARLNALLENLEGLNGVHAKRFSGIQSLMDGIQSEISSYHQTVTAVDNTFEKNMTRLTALEELFHDRFSIKAAIRRQILPVIALLFSIGAISLHFVHQR